MSACRSLTDFSENSLEYLKFNLSNVDTFRQVLSFEKITGIQIFMKAATTKGFGLNAPITLTESKVPVPGFNDVLVEVYASSVNPKDWKLNQTLSSMVPAFGFIEKPLVIGDDLAGIVVAKGSRVNNFKVGDAVYGMDMHLRTAACAEFARIDAACIAHKPNNISFEEAAACPLAGLTALQGLRLGRVGTGSRVLIIGASGGVGTFTVQLAKAMGAIVTGVCSERNIQLVRKLGASDVIDYRKVDITKLKGGYDVVFDVTSYQSLFSCSKLLKPAGIFISTAGNASAIMSSIRDRLLYQHKESKIVRVNPNKPDLERLANYIDQGLVKPVIDSRYPLEDINSAYLRNKSGHCAGKVIVQVK